MARWYEPSAEARQAWDEWLAERPQEVYAVAFRFPPWNLYRMTSTGQRVYLRAFDEDGTVRVVVDARFNLLCTFDREVFGVDPDDLTECELPGRDEWVGSPATGYAMRFKV